MGGFFDRMLGRGRTTQAKSALVAKERLQFVLVHDRIDLPPERLSEMKAKILAVISEFVNISTDDVDITLRQKDRNSNIIVAEIPFSHSYQSDEELDENDETNESKLQLDDDALFGDTDHATS